MLVRLSNRLFWVAVNSILLFALSHFVAGAPTNSAAISKRGSTLRLAVGTDPHSLDPALIFSNEEAMLAYFLFDTLLDPNPKGGFTPALAESLPTTSPDGLTHTFRLRKGVKFSNGRELVADDVVYTFERFFDQKTPGTVPTYYRSIKVSLAFEEARKKEIATSSNFRPPGGGRWIEPLTVCGLLALDRYTVQIRLDQPDLSFLHVLAVAMAGIVPREEVERTGPGFSTRPVGTGRFVLKEWVRGARLRFARNPFDFRANQPGAQEVEVLVNVDQTTQTMMFERGELYFQSVIPNPDFVRLKKTPEFPKLLQVVNGTSPVFIYMNCELAPFTNRMVRLALNHAVDKQGIVKTLSNRCVPARGPLPLVISGFNRNLPEYAYDPPKARALLAEAGFPDGFETTLWTNHDDQTRVRIALRVQQYLKEIGVRVQIKEVSYPAMLEAGGRRKTVPMGVWDWVTIADDPKETLDSLLNGDTITDEGCMNTAFYTNPRVQQLFRDAVAESDVTRRLEIYRQIEHQVVEDVPWIFLVQMNTEMLLQPWVKGFQPRGFWPPMRLENCWLEK
jgi:ABC-type transport system substrate-binding protein